MSAIAVGQVWRRKSDARLFTVLGIESELVHNRRVTIRGQRRSTLLVRAFLRQYEFVGLAGWAPVKPNPYSPTSGMEEPS